MAVTRWSPFSEFLSLQREMDRIFGRPLFGRYAPSLLEGTWTPAMEVVTRKNDLLVRLELPGVDPKDVDISVRDDILTVRGERRESKEVKEEDYYCCEICYGSFQRSLTLPQGVRAENIKANFSNGILEITVPQAVALAQPKKIPIEAKERKIKVER